MYTHPKQLLAPHYEHVWYAFFPALSDGISLQFSLSCIWLALDDGKAYSIDGKGAGDFSFFCTAFSFDLMLENCIQSMEKCTF